MPAGRDYRLRYDRLDTKGRMTLLRAGSARARTRVLALADDHQVVITDLATGEVF